MFRESIADTTVRSTSTRPFMSDELHDAEFLFVPRAILYDTGDLSYKYRLVSCTEEL
jgi:hypothetical protein